MVTTMPSGVSPGAWVTDPDDVLPNERYGPGVEHLFHFFRNATQDAGGNALAIEVHGGSWKANDAYGFATSPSSVFGTWWTGYLLNSAVQGTTRRHFHVASAEYRCFAHQGITTNDYTEAYDETPGGTRVQVKSLRRRWTSSIDDIQRLVQYFKRHAAYYGINPDLIFLIGHSVGACTSMAAAFSVSRAFNEKDKGEFAAHHNSYVAGVINQGGEIDLDPWKLYIRHAMFAAGCVEADQSAAGVRGDMERLLLEPDENGAYPQGQPKTALAKAMSPVDLIENAPPETARTPICSYYWSRHNPVGPYVPPGTYEETVPPVGDYGGAPPPDDGSGHFYQQWARLDAVCAAKDAARGDGYTMHSGRVLDAFDFYPTVELNSIRASHDFMVQDGYTWMCDRCDEIDPP